MPFERTICPKVDLALKRLEVAAPEGLLDLFTAKKMKRVSGWTAAGRHGFCLQQDTHTHITDISIYIYIHRHTQQCLYFGLLLDWLYILILSTGSALHG